jgi:hypothetical protein
MDALEARRTSDHPGLELQLALPCRELWISQWAKRSSAQVSLILGRGLRCSWRLPFRNGHLIGAGKSKWTLCTVSNGLTEAIDDRG